MTDVIEQDPHALAIIARLEAATLIVGDGEAPLDEDGEKIPPPYSVLYMLPGGEVDGSAASPDSDGDIRFQLTHVGRLPAEARWQADRAGAELVGHPLVVPGRSVRRVRPLEASNRVERDDDVTPPLFYVPARFGAWTFPA